MIAESEKAKVFEQIMTECRSSLQIFVKNHVRCDLRADAEQSILLAIWKSLDGFEGRCSLKTWVYRVACNAVQKFVNAEQHATGISIGPAPACSPADSDGILAVEKFAATLNDLDRTMLLMYLDQCSYKEIAEATRVAEGAARVRICRLKEKFTEFAGS